MVQKAHRPGIKPNFLMKRRVGLTKIDDVKAAAIVSAIDSVTGIDKVSFNTDRLRLELIYDASQVDFDHFLNIVKQNGVEVGNDWWSRLKHGWYQFTDENAKANADHKPSCCNKPPRR